MTEWMDSLDFLVDFIVEYVVYYAMENLGVLLGCSMLLTLMLGWLVWLVLAGDVVSKGGFG